MLDLVNSFSLVRSPTDTAFFLQDLLTANEIRNLAVRLRIAKLLVSGKNQREIRDGLHTSFATIVKVSIWLEESGVGFRNVLKRLPLKYKIPKNLPPIPIEFQLPQVLLALGQYTLAKKQRGVIEKFAKSVEKKEYSDREIREALNEHYASASKRRNK